MDSRALELYSQIKQQTEEREQSLKDVYNDSALAQPDAHPNYAGGVRRVLVNNTLKLLRVDLGRVQDYIELFEDSRLTDLKTRIQGIIRTAEAFRPTLRAIEKQPSPGYPDPPRYSARGEQTSSNDEARGHSSPTDSVRSFIQSPPSSGSSFIQSRRNSGESFIQSPPGIEGETVAGEVLRQFGQQHSPGSNAHRR
jgi:hypothetical protein